MSMPALLLSERAAQAPDAAFAQALAHHKNGEIEQAAALYMRAIQLDPHHIGALFNLAALHAALGLKQEAERGYREVLKVSPADADALSNLGNLLQPQGRIEEAEDLYRRALVIKPSHTVARVNYGNLLLGQQRYAEAEPHFRRAVVLAPHSAGAHSGLGATLWRLGQRDEARRHLSQAVALAPAEADAINGLANLLAEDGDLDRAKALYEQALGLRPDWPEVRFNLALVLERTDCRDEAKAALRRAVELKPDYARALLHLGELEAEDHEMEAAEEHLLRGASLTPPGAITEFHIGTLHHYKREYEKAVACFERSVALDPTPPEVWNNLGNANLELNRLVEAERAFEKAIELAPDFAQAYNNLGKLLRGRGDSKGAEARYRKALELKPDFAVACSNLGALLVERGEYESATSYFEKALAIQPTHALFNGIGILHQMQNDNEKSIAAFEKALELEPNNPEILNNLAISYQNLGRNVDAARTYDRVFDANPNQAEAYLNLGNMLLSLSKHDEAVTVYRKALQIRPDNRAIYPYLAHALMHQCSWSNIGSIIERLIANTECELANDLPMSATPFGLLSLPTTVDLRHRLSERVAGKIVANVAPTRAVTPMTYAPRGPKLKIGYLSPDLRNHSVALLFNGIVKNHDRSRFELHGYMTGTMDRDHMTEFFRSEFDAFNDFKDATLVDAARKINADGINVLVDLAGHTRGSWLHLCAMKPAPVSASAIGYASSLGSGLVDYLITDETLWPEPEQKYCSEKLCYLPHTSMPGSRREVANHPFTRAEMGLPETGVVFANFNGHYKFDPETFAVWMRILKRVPGSVLWIMKGSTTSRENLKREAETRGVPAERLVFADNLMGPYHMARLGLADIALDSYYHVGGATTMDALYAGVPVLVTAGTNVSNRTGRNLLEVCDMPELIAPTLREYEQIAVDLALNPDRLAALRAKLADKVRTTPLFDIELFTRNFERALEMIWENYEARNEPRHMRVPSQDVVRP